MSPNDVQPRQLHCWDFSLALGVFHSLLPEGRALKGSVRDSQDVFVASHYFCMICKFESTLRGRLNSGFETSIKVLHMPDYKKRPRSSLGLWGVVDKHDFNRRS